MRILLARFSFAVSACGFSRLATLTSLNPTLEALGLRRTFDRNLRINPVL